MARITLFVAGALAWWVLLVGVWVLTLSTVSGSELIVAGLCALPCAVVALLAGRALRSRWRMPAAALRWVPAVAVGAVTDTVRVLLGRSGPPRVRAVVLRDAGAGAAARDTRRALATIAIAATPGSVVLDERGDRGLGVHVLGTGRPDVPEVVGS
jgi:multisubunit Na+/H+ antiporter MnhE subunit